MNTIGLLVSVGLLVSAAPVEAGGMGKFLGSLLARGAIRGAIEAGRSNGSTVVYAPKIYGADVLTVDQLAGCIKSASALDGEADRVEAARSSLLPMKLAIDDQAKMIEMQRMVLNHSSKKSVDSFNALIDSYNAAVTAGKAKQADFNAMVGLHNASVDSYNAACAKRFYADDMDEAKKRASIN